MTSDPVTAPSAIRPAAAPAAGRAAADPRPVPAFVAQLIAGRLDLPQQRRRRRLDPATAMRRYVPALARAAGFDRSL